jgi:biofilm protein TabA
MILDRLENAQRYVALHPDFAKAFTFLRQPRLESLPLEKIEIDGVRVIQYVISGVDEMGWKTKSTCRKPDTPYDAEKDFELFSDPADAWVAVGPGAFTVFFPEDAHAPLIGKGELHKIVIKVAV